MENLTEYAKRRANMTVEQIEYENARRRKKDAERRKKRTNEEKERRAYIKKRATARAFLRDRIKDEDKEEFINLLESLRG